MRTVLRTLTKANATCSAAEVDGAHYSPAAKFVRSLFDDADKLMPQDPFKACITFDDLKIGTTDSGQRHSY
jgi:hypothetical protein